MALRRGPRGRPRTRPVYARARLSSCLVRVFPFGRALAHCFWSLYDDFDSNNIYILLFCTRFTTAYCFFFPVFFFPPTITPNNNDDDYESVRYRERTSENLRHRCVIARGFVHFFTRITRRPSSAKTSVRGKFLISRMSSTS